MECKVIELKPMGQKGGAGNLMICEVLVMHINEQLLDPERKINPASFQQVARLGGDWYAKMDSSVLFELPKPELK